MARTTAIRGMVLPPSERTESSLATMMEATMQRAPMYWKRDMSRLRMNWKKKGDKLLIYYWTFLIYLLFVTEIYIV